jgi:hypothetical protein
MRRHKVLLVAVFLTTIEIVAANVTAKAQHKTVDLTGETNHAVISVARLTRVARKPTSPLDQAYQDAIRILSKNNSCSHFFGGPNAAEEVLSRLAVQFQLHLLRDSSTGIEMSGIFTYFEQTEQHTGYRLFAAATINTLRL